MNELSHWDFAEKFSAFDAAALILGYEPRNSVDVQSQVNVVYERMEMHYLSALKKAEIQTSGVCLDNENEIKILDQDLPSVELQRLWSNFFFESDEFTFIEWLQNTRKHQFANQEFSREKLAQWLVAIGMKSRYEFRRDESHNVPLDGNELWPWGNYTTINLGHLAAAGSRYYGANYDPSDPSTAPRNEDVSQWLQKEHKVSKTIASAIATILRPNGLPPGPR